MDGRTDGQVKRRRLRTGMHKRPLHIAVGAELDERLRRTAERYGYAVAVIARDAIEQGLGLTEAALEREVGRAREAAPRKGESRQPGLWSEGGAER